jgi:hypothetical protein
MVYGLSLPSSDVDVCVDVTCLKGLASDPGANFTVKDNLLDLSMQRLVLTHTNGTEIDLVGMQWYDEKKYTVMSRVCEVPTFRSFLVMIKSWWKEAQSKYDFKPVDGYPNTFNMLLLGVFYLQMSEFAPGTVWRVLAASNPPVISSELGHTDVDIFRSFLGFLLHKRSCTIKMDLRKRECQAKIKKGSNHGLWLLMDPTNGRNVFSALSIGKVHQIIKRVVLPQLDVLY